ncbi:MAG: hypothetical protein AAGJ50_14255, partial [Pseudomonadota bacterium]
FSISPRMMCPYPMGFGSIAAQQQGGWRVFNITEDDVPVSHGVWVHRLAERLGWSGDIVRVADSNHPIAQATAAIDLSVDLKVSGAVFRRETGFKPPYSIEDGLQSLIAG